MNVYVKVTGYGTRCADWPWTVPRPAQTPQPPSTRSRRRAAQCLPCTRAGIYGHSTGEETGGSSSVSPAPNWAGVRQRPASARLWRGCEGGLFTVGWQIETTRGARRMAAAGGGVGPRRSRFRSSCGRHRLRGSALPRRRPPGSRGRPSRPTGPSARQRPRSTGLEPGP